MTGARHTYDYYLANWCDIQDHLPRLLDRAHGNCMEIGVRHSVSTAALLTGLEQHGGHLISFDIEDCSALFHDHPQWTFYRMDSVNESEAIKKLLPEHLDLLFIDGDHSYQAVIADLYNYGARADCILLHDTDAQDFPGVLRAVRQYVEESGRPVTYHTGSYGMAEITR